MIKIKNHIKLSLKISPLNPGKEILIARLDQLKFVGFVEKHNGLECYIPSNKWNNKVLDIFYPLEEKGIDIDWCIDFVEDENWNSQWEQNFSPVFIGDSCVIRSDFHKKTNINHEIIIKPKMSFGTGHHETTQLIIEELLKNPIHPYTKRLISSIPVPDPSYKREVYEITQNDLDNISNLSDNKDDLYDTGNNHYVATHKIEGLL